MSNNSEPAPRPSVRIGELERKLAARDKTVMVLMDRVEAFTRNPAYPPPAIADGDTLALVASRRDEEIEEQRAQLASAIEELHRAQTRLLQAQKLESIGQLAAGIAHEINTPTQYVTDNTEFLSRSFAKLRDVVAASTELLAACREGAPPPELVARVGDVFRRGKLDYVMREAPRAIEQSLEGLRRVTAIVSAMKDFSHPSSGEKAPVDLNEAIASTVTVATNEWKYVADVETRLAEDLPAVYCLRDEINQVVLNLIVNAAHAIAAVTDEGASGKGTITIATRRVRDEVEISVSDTGGGVPEEFRGRVFDPFFTTKPVGKGTGQGLAIAYSVVVEKHGGQISVETAPSGGARFVVRLPIGSAPPSSFRGTMVP